MRRFPIWFYTVLFIATLSLLAAHFNLRQVLIHNQHHNQDNSVTFSADITDRQHVEANEEEVENKDIDHPTCVVTSSAWKNVALVRILFDSARKQNPNVSSCMIWYVADDPYRPEPKMTEIQQILADSNISIVTIDHLSQTVGNLLDYFYSQVFCKPLSEQEVTDLLLPYIFIHVISVRKIPHDHVIYLDTSMWNDNNPGSYPSNSNLARLVQKQVVQDLQQNRSSYTQLLEQYQASSYDDIPHGFHHFSDGTPIEPWMCNHYTDMTTVVDMMDEHTLYWQSWVYARIRFQDTVYKNPFATTATTHHYHVTFMEWLLSGPYTKAVDMQGDWFLSDTEDKTYHAVTKDLDTEDATDDAVADDLSDTDNTTDEAVTVTKDVSDTEDTTDDAVADDLSDTEDATEDAVTKDVSDTEDTTDDEVANNTVADPYEYGYVEFKKWFQSDTMNKMTLISSEIHRKVIDKDTHHRNNHWIYHKNASTSDIGLNIIGWHGGLFGVGKTASKMYHSAISAGIQVNAIAMEPVWNHQFIHPRELGYPLSRSCSEQVNLFMINADCTFMGHNAIPYIIWQNKYNIGYWEWELSIFRDDQMQFVAHYDEVWAPSQFIADSITKSRLYDGKTPVRVVPLPLLKEEMETSSNDERKNTSYLWQSLLNKLEDAFIFLIVFDYSSLKERKNPDASIRAFLDAFPLVQDKENKYHLIVKSHHGSDEELDELKNVTQHDPRIHLLIDVLSNEDHYDLQHRADCYVSLHRSEGYGMNLLEEMGNGIPVIATNYSGNVAFFPPLEKLFGTCYFPVPYQLIQLRESYGPYKRGNRWADPDHNFTVNAMREVVKHNCKAKFGKEASELTMSVFGRGAVGRKLKKVLGELQPLIIEKERKMTKILL